MNKYSWAINYARDMLQSEVPDDLVKVITRACDLLGNINCELQSRQIVAVCIALWENNMG